MPDSEEIFKLFTDVKGLSVKAQSLGLQDIHSILNYISDRLVHEYYKYARDPVEEVRDLNWNEENWPSATAVLLEMKSMILAMERAEQKDTALSAQNDK